MNAASRVEPKPPVGVIDSLSAGFETVYRHLGLLLIPILLDLFLWAGPKISIQPLIDRFAIASQSIWSTQPPDVRAQLQSLGQAEVQFFTLMGQHLNVFALFNTSPVGVPSLMVEKLLDDYSRSNPEILFSNSDWRLFAHLDVHMPVLADWQTSTGLVAVWMLLANLAAVLQPGFDPSRLAQAPVDARSPLTLPLTNELQFVLLVIALPLAGLLLTSLYYSQIGSVLREPATSVRDLARRSAINWAKLTAFNLAIRILLICVGAPFLLFLAALQLVSIDLSSILAALGVTAGVWFMLYISFSMQSVVLQDRGVLGAMWDSIQLVHVNLISVIGLTGLSFLLNWGMNYLFSLAGGESWLTLLGIAGHAFLSTSLLATTFIFYKDRHRWWTEMRQWLVTQARRQR